MASKLNAKAVTLSLVSVSVLLSLLCALAIALAPQFSMQFLGSIFHGIDIAKIAVPITLNGVLMGFVAVTLVAIVTGWLFTIIYNRVSSWIE